MITHCPSCNTNFRVHAEQLAARAGQVRCGKCNQVFNALERLIEETAPVYEPRSSHGFAVIPADTAVAGPRAESAEANDFGAGSETQASVGVAEAGAQGQEPAIAEGTDLEANASPPAAEKPDRALAPPDASSFDFGPIAAANPEKSARRWPWLLGALLMLSMLLAQSAYNYRGAITLVLPQTKPYAAALCAKLGCDLPLPRRIDLMSIEASDLQADTTNANVMVLTATIKNRAIFNQQYPFLELTLTDSQDQPLVRRVLAPQDYSGKGFNTQLGVAANSEVAIKVIIEGAQVKATGYRLYLFYP